jgi:hypothetical protein
MAVIEPNLTCPRSHAGQKDRRGLGDLNIAKRFIGLLLRCFVADNGVGGARGCREQYLIGGGTLVSCLTGHVRQPSGHATVRRG